MRRAVLALELSVYPADVRENGKERIISAELFCLIRITVFLNLVILEAVRRTGSFYCHNTKLLRTRCVSQAQNAPKLDFRRGSAWTPLRELAALLQNP